MGLIPEFNRRQAITGGLFMAAGAFIVWITWVALQAVFLASSILTQYSESKVDKIASTLTFASVVIGVVYWWRAGERYRVFRDQLFVAGLRREKGEDIGPFAVGDDEEPVTGIRDLMAQIFLSGPRLICTGVARIQSRLPDYPDLERRMQTLLEQLRAKPQWQLATAYADQAEEMGGLLRAGLAEFSLSKMLVKAVSDQPPPPLAEGDEVEDPGPLLRSPVAPTPLAPPSSVIPSLTVSAQPVKPIVKMAAPNMPPPQAPPATSADLSSSAPVEKAAEPDGGTPV